MSILNIAEIAAKHGVTAKGVLIHVVADLITTAHNLGVPDKFMELLTGVVTTGNLFGPVRALLGINPSPTPTPEGHPVGMLPFKESNPPVVPGPQDVFCSGSGLILPLVAGSVILLSQNRRVRNVVRDLWKNK